MGASPASPNDILKNQAMQQVLMHAPLMALLGGGARGAVGLVNFLNRSTRTPPKPFRRRSLLLLPGDVQPAPKTAQLAAPSASASAAPPAGAAAPSAGLGSYFSHPFLTQLAQSITDATGITVPGGTPTNRPALTAFSAGDHATHARDLPWKLPATFGLGIASGLGGYHLMDRALDTTRKMDVDSELDAAKEEYERALRGLSQKHAAAEPLAQTFDWFEKAGGLGNIASLYLTALMTAGAGTGLATYNYTRARSRDKILEEAAKRRRSQIFQQTQMPMFARIQPPSAPVDAHAANA